MLLLCLPTCATCRRARAFLDARGIAYTARDIRLARPTQAELERWAQMSGLAPQHFFNTSGRQYRALGLAARLPGMSDAQQLALLASDGMLVKRPVLVGDGFVLAGFREAQWAALL